ncbi:hypothetical protein P3S67_011118 [Capsicum chacoense]
MAADLSVPTMATDLTFTASHWRSHPSSRRVVISTIHRQQPPHAIETNPRPRPDQPYRQPLSLSIRCKGFDCFLQQHMYNSEASYSPAIEIELDFHN